jgi:hypothetical protein
LRGGYGEGDVRGRKGGVEGVKIGIMPV